MSDAKLKLSILEGLDEEDVSYVEDLAWDAAGELHRAYKMPDSQTEAAFALTMKALDTFCRERDAILSTVRLPNAHDDERVVVGTAAKYPELMPALMKRIAPETLFPERTPRRLWITLTLMHSKMIPFSPETIAQTAGLDIQGKVELSGILDAATKDAALLEHHVNAVQLAAIKRAGLVRTEELSRAFLNGADHEQIAALIGDLQKATRITGRFLVQNIRGVVPERPEFTVAGFVRRHGVHLVWGEPSACKTWLLMLMLLELLVARPGSGLFGHPGLTINRPYRRVLWIGTEESGPVFRSKLDRVMAGLGITDLDGGEFIHLWASDPRQPFDLMGLTALVEAEGPFDCIMLDSITGLRPRTMNGQTIKWDLDNDATNTLMLMLRGLAASKGIDIVIVHHTGREKGRYRGPADLWASADVMTGFIPEDGAVRVVVEKNRDGARPPAFTLTPSWEGDAFTVEYAGGAAVEVSLPPSAVKALDYLREVGEATQATIEQKTKATRPTIRKAMGILEDARLVTRTDKTVNGSPVFRFMAGGG